MKKTRKGLAILLSVLLALTLFAPLSVVSFAEGEEPSVVASGYCGADENHTDAEWTLTSDGLLTIEGSGEVTNPTHIGSSAWYEYLEDIKEVVVGDGITKLPGSAFDYCVNLETISYPKTLSTYDDGQLFYCPSLKTIIMDPENPNFTVGADSCLYSKDMTELIKYPAGLERTSFSIPDGVTKLRFAAFYETHALQQIVVPDSVTVLEDEVFYGCSALTDVNIPPHVTSFGTCMFYNCSSLERFAIPDYFTEIPALMFEGCTSLVSVEIPENVTKIGSRAFRDCRSMPTIELHDGITEIGQGAFGECRALESIILPCNITTIERQTFVNCDSLQWITIPAAVRSIGEQAFGEVEMFGCTSLEAVYYMGTDYAWNHSVYVAEKNSSLQNATVYCHRDGHHVFTEELVTEPTAENEGLKRYSCTLCPYSYTETLPACAHVWNGVYIVYPTETTDGEIRYTCTECGYSYTDTVPATPYQDWLYTESEPIEHKQIGEHVYYTLYADGHASIYGSGDSYTDAEWNDEQNRSIFGLSQRDNVTSIEIHEGVTGLLMDFACSSCHSVQSLKLPKSFINMTWQTFCHCSALQTIEVDPANPSWTAADNVLFNKDQTELVLCAISKPGETYTIPATVETIGINAFFCNKNLKEITIPGSVRTIGETAFMGCEALETVHFNDGLETMERGAFYRCYALKSVELPASVTVLGDYVFGDEESLTSITLPNGLTSIGEYAIGCCPQVKSITIPGSVTSIGSSAFWNWTSLQHVYFTCTQAEWDAIEIGEWNEPLQDTNTQIHFGGHSYDDGVITTPVNCDGNSVKTFTCVYCGNTYIETTPTSLPAGDHAWGDWTIAQNSTDTEPGLAQRVCQANPDHTESFAIPAYGPAIEIGDCGQDGDEVYYIVYEDGTLLITGTGAIRSDMFNSGNVSVSANVHNTNRLIIEDGVTAIGNSAFAFLRFNSIDFGNTLVSIGYDAFYDNDGFETVVLPDSVKTVGDCAFGLSSYLKTVVFGPNVETVGDWALGQCYNLENVVFLNKDTQIMEGEHQEHLGTVLHTVNSGTIYGYAGGAVETYARTYGFRFIPLDDENWIRLPYGTDGLADGDWYFDDETFVDIIGRDKTQAEKDAVLESLHRHVTFYYYPNGGLFLIRYDYDKLPIEGVPVSGSAVYPFDFIVKPDAASVFDCEAMAESIAQYTAPTQPDNPQPDNPQPDQPQQEESSPRLIDRLLAPFKAFVSMVLSFFRKMFR